MNFLFASDPRAGEGAIPYCGPAPVPADLWTVWNLDPWVIGGLLLLMAGFLLSPGRRGTSERTTFCIALSMLVVAFLSPLCALSAALFSARVAHHILLVSIAAPLLAVAFRPALGWLRVVPLSALFIIHTTLLWVWHAPGPYAFALSSDTAYWLMEGSLILSAIAFWHALWRTDLSDTAVLSALLGSTIQMGFLGALFTFAGAPLQAPHLTTTFAFGLSPLEDQQLAGLIMWVPASTVYIGIALLRSWRMLTPKEHTARGKI